MAARARGAGARKKLGQRTRPGRPGPRLVGAGACRGRFGAQSAAARVRGEQWQQRAPTRRGRGLIALTARTLAPRARGQPTQRASRRQLESAIEHERTPTRPLATVQSQAASQHFLNWN
jgi:hypothetical protein